MRDVWHGGLAALLCAALLGGCAAGTRGQLLHTFFDGVPDESVKAEDGAGKTPTDTENGKPGAGTPKPAAPSTFFHDPFLENMCDSCHDSTASQKLVANGRELCFTCHDDFTKDKKVMHYPVEEDECLECHEPHQSFNEKLLKKKVPQMCYECHDEEELKAQPAHRGKDKCLDCHDPHATDREKLLK